MFLSLYSQTKFSPKNTTKIVMAQIFESIWGDSWSVEYKIGNTVYNQHFDTLREAEDFCRDNGLQYAIYMDEL